MNITAALMLKAPCPGTVKTRLASSIGPIQACEVYQQLVDAQLREIPADWAVAVHYSPAESISAMREWLAGGGIMFHPQPDGDLGCRMYAAVSGHLNAGADAVALIGGDCPGLVGRVLLKAAAALQSVDVVIIPATDGGYVSLMCKKPDAELFTGIDWSTSKVLSQTLAAAGSAGLSVRLLEPLEDVDDLESMQRCGIRPDLWR